MKFSLILTLFLVSYVCGEYLLVKIDSNKNELNNKPQVYRNLHAKNVGKNKTDGMRMKGMSGQNNMSNIVDSLMKMVGASNDGRKKKIILRKGKNEN